MTPNDKIFQVFRRHREVVLSTTTAIMLPVLNDVSAVEQPNDPTTLFSKPDFVRFVPDTITAGIGTHYFRWRVIYGQFNDACEIVFGPELVEEGNYVG